MRVYPRNRHQKMTNIHTQLNSSYTRDNFTCKVASHFKTFIIVFKSSQLLCTVYYCNIFSVNFHGKCRKIYLKKRIQSDSKSSHQNIIKYVIAYDLEIFFSSFLSTISIETIIIQRLNILYFPYSYYMQKNYYDKNIIIMY